MTKPTIIFTLILVLGCTTAATQTAQQPAAAAATASPHKNLQVLPRDIPRDELIAIMRTFARSLGVRCNHCHVVTATEPKEVLDFPADTKEEKRVARVMIQMTQQINGAWMERVETAEHGESAHASTEPAEMRVGCWTCHRGKTEPELPPPPPPPGQ
jgi:cytochrome c553